MVLTADGRGLIAGRVIRGGAGRWGLVPKVLGHARSRPSWVSLYSPDIEASKAFYGTLLGWESYVLSSDLIGDYTVFTLPGPPEGKVGGMSASDDPSSPATWLLYFQGPDSEAFVQRVPDLGGRVLLPPSRLEDLGMMGLAQDTEGVEFGLWQPYLHQDAAVAGGLDALSWVELASRDLPAARRFYEGLLDWSSVNRSEDRLVWADRDGPVAEAAAMDDQRPSGDAPHWVPHFTVNDCDEAAARAAEAGARIRTAPVDRDQGRFCDLIDPQGAHLALLCPPHGKTPLQGFRSLLHPFKGR